MIKIFFIFMLNGEYGIAEMPDMEMCQRWVQHYEENHVEAFCTWQEFGES